MKKTKAMAILLSIVITFTFVCGSITTNAEESVPANIEIPVSDSDYTVEGTNSFGRMLSNEISYQSDEQEESSEGVVYSAEVTDKTVSITYSAIKDCKLLAAVYDETGVKMLGSGTAEVSAEDTEAEVTLDIAAMPRYFYLRVFIIDSETLKPLSKAYECSNYTRDMQDFLSKTTDDFDADKVLNLDADKTNNFAVFKEGVKVISHSDSVNTLKTADEDKMYYVIENVDDSVKALETDDIFVYGYDDGSLLIAKVSTINVVGGTATITGQDTDISEVFAYVKVNTSESLYDAPQSRNASIYEGSSAYMSGNTYNDVEIAHKQELKGKVNIVENVDFEYEVKPSITFFLDDDLELDYVDLKIDYEFGVAFNFFKAVELKEELKLGRLRMHMSTGIFIGMEPAIKVDAKISGKCKYAIKGRIGVRYEDGVGENISTKPQVVGDITSETKLDVFFEPNFNIHFICERFKFIVSTGIGSKIDAKGDVQQAVVGSERHDCAACLSIKVTPTLRVSIGCSLARKRYMFPVCEIKGESLGAYFSLDRLEFGWGSCPYKSHLVKVKVVDSSGKAVSSIDVTQAITTDILGTTDQNGETEIWFKDGKQSIVSSNRDEIGEKTFEVDETTHYITLNMQPRKSGSSNNNNNNNNNESTSTPDIHNPTIKENDVVIGNIIYRPCYIKVYENGVYVKKIDFYDIIDYVGNPVDVVLHDKINGIKVNCNYLPSFKNCQSLKSIDIKVPITTVKGTKNGKFDAGAFIGCTNLESVTLPDTVKEIGGFSNCTSLKKINIPDSVETIGGFLIGGFDNCTSLKSIIIPDSVTSIYGSAFSGCSSLESINIPDSVTSIRNCFREAKLHCF